MWLRVERERINLEPTAYNMWLFKHYRNTGFFVREVVFYLSLTSEYVVTQ